MLDPRRIPGLALAALIACLPLAAQAGGDDPFAPGAFDSGASAGTAGTTGAPGACGAAPAAPGPATARTEYLLGGSALIQAGATLPPGLEGYAATSFAAGKAFAKVSVPDYGSLYISYNFYVPFLAALGGTDYAALVPPLALGTPTWSIAEVHYSFDVAKLLFVRLGKQLISWGPSLVWNPVDFINPQKADAFSSVDLRAGKPGLRLHAPLGSSNAFAFLDFSGLVSGASVKDLAEGLNYGLRLDTTLGGFELGLSGYGGASSQARLGLDFSGYLLGFTAYGDLAWAPAYDSYGQSLKAGLGLSRTLGGLRRLSLSAEAFWQSDGADLTGQPAALAASPALYSGAYYAYAALEAKEFLSPDLTTKVSALANLSDYSWRITLNESLALPRAVPLTLSLSYSGGGADKEFTWQAGNGNLSLGIRTLISF